MGLFPSHVPALERVLDTLVPCQLLVEHGLRLRAKLLDGKDVRGDLWANFQSRFPLGPPCRGPERYGTSENRNAGISLSLRSAVHHLELNIDRRHMQRVSTAGPVDARTINFGSKT